MGLTVKKGVDEDTGESCFMLINTQNRMVGVLRSVPHPPPTPLQVGQNKDLGTKVQSQFTAAELDYLRLLASEILQSDHKTISSRLALNLMDQVAFLGDFSPGQ